jgi:hypothetical protein
LSLLSSVGTSGAVLFRFPNNPNLVFDVDTLGLGVRVAVPLACSRGFRSGIIPSPEGAGVASLGDGITRLGDGFREGSREPSGGRMICSDCRGEIATCR